jgi:DNA-binding response OmpR family regulator
MLLAVLGILIEWSSSCKFMHTILIVDDEETDRENIRRILEGKGYTVVEGDSLEAAMAVFEQHRYSIGLLVADVSLPGGNGCDLAVALSKQKSDLRVLFVSGHVGAEVCQYYGLEVSGEHFLQKPFEAAELLSKVSQIMDAEASFPKFCAPRQLRTRNAG